MKLIFELGEKRQKFKRTITDRYMSKFSQDSLLIFFRGEQVITIVVLLDQNKPQNNRRVNVDVTVVVHS